MVSTIAWFNGWLFSIRKEGKKRAESLRWFHTHTHTTTSQDFNGTYTFEGMAM